MVRKKRMKKTTISFPELVNEKIVNAIYNSNDSIWTLAEKNNGTIEDIQDIIKQYDDSLNARMEYDKKIRKEIRELLSDVEKGLASLRSEMESINISSDPVVRKSYCEVFDGENWVGEPKRLGNSSFITQKIINKEIV